MNFGMVFSTTISVTQDGTVSCNKADSFSPAASRTNNLHTVRPPISLCFYQIQVPSINFLKNFEFYLNEIYLQLYVPKYDWSVFWYRKIVVSFNHLIV